MVRILGWLLVTIALLPSAGGARAQIDADTAEALVRDSGIWQQMSSMAPQVRTGFLQAVGASGAKPSQAEVERLSNVIDRAYSADRLRSTAIRIIQNDTQIEHAPALLDWYASPVGKVVARLEEEASADQLDPHAVMQQGTSLRASMPADRRAMLDELVAITRSAENLVQITIDTTLAAQRGAASVIPSGPAASPMELKAALDAQRPQLEAAFTQLMRASSALAYAALPDSELAQYLEFLSSKAGRHFNEVGTRAFGAALVEASTEFGRGLPGTKDSSNA